jgi:hypothetical protein
MEDRKMRKLSKAVGIATVVAAAGLAAQSAQAWWGGGPWGGWPGSSSWADDWFGDGWGDFNMSMSGGGRGWGRNRYYDHYGPWWGGPYGYGGYPGWGGWGGPYGVPYAAPVAPAPATEK